MDHRQAPACEAVASVQSPSVEPGSRLLPLSRGLFAIVDEADFDRLNRYKWSAHKSDGYQPTYRASRSAVSGGKRTTILLHREIAGVGTGVPVCHRDGNGLNNRRSNLLISSKEAAALGRRAHRDSASSPYKGVSLVKARGQYEARFRGRRLGLFKIEALAALAYDAAAKAYGGDLARLNFQDGESTAIVPRDAGAAALRGTSE